MEVLDCPAAPYSELAAPAIPLRRISLSLLVASAWRLAVAVAIHRAGGLGKPWGQSTKARHNPSRLRPKKTREVALEREN